jgi:hypothetical protein
VNRFSLALHGIEKASSRSSSAQTGAELLTTGLACPIYVLKRTNIEHTTPLHNKALAQDIAVLGYDVVVCDGNKILATGVEGQKSVMEQARQMPRALPGKVATIILSLGGGLVLAYGSQMVNEWRWKSPGIRLPVSTSGFLGVPAASRFRC